MPFVIAIVAMLSMPSAIAAKPVSQEYWLFLNADGRTWCGYDDADAFKSAVAGITPSESAKVTYASGSLAEVTYQVEPASADWIVIDQYTPSTDSTILRRTNLLAQQGLEIIQELTIRAGKVEPFRLLSVTKLTGQKAEAPRTTNFPSLPIRTNLAQMPFMAVVDQMRTESIGKLCR